MAPEVKALEAAAREREVRLTTTGRKSGNPHSVTVWIETDGDHIFVRSGEGMRRDWPQNLMAAGEATLHLGGGTLKVRPRHITDPAEARSISRLAREKYGSYVKVSKPEDPLTQAELASFELIPIP